MKIASAMSKNTAIIAAIALLGLLWIGYHYGVVKPRTDAARKAVNQKEILEIFKACKIYASDSEGTFPRTLNDLIDEEILYAVPFYTSRNGERAPFVFVAPNLHDAAPPGFVIAHAPVPEADGTYLFASNDLGIGYLTRDQLDAELENNKKGRNGFTVDPGHQDEVEAR